MMGYKELAIVLTKLGITPAEALEAVREWIKSRGPEEPGRDMDILTRSITMAQYEIRMGQKVS